MGTEKNAETYEQLVKAAKKKYLEGLNIELGVSLPVLVNQTAMLKATYDETGKILDAFKKFFKEIGEPGEHFEGDVGYIDLVGRASSTVEPEKLKELLVSLDRDSEFLGMVTVKVADARTKLGTMLFDKIAETAANASITVKIGTKK
jgi:hypothetical protein